MTKRDMLVAALREGLAIHDVTEAELEDAEEELELQDAISHLTETQYRRLLARAQGSTLQQIASAEGVSTSAVDQTLNSAGVQKAMSILGISISHLTICRTTVENGKSALERIDPILEAIKGLISIANNATRAVVVSDGHGVTRVQNVPDYVVRLNAFARFLSLVDRRAPPPAVAGDSPPRSSLELEQTQTTSTSRRVRVS